MSRSFKSIGVERRVTIEEILVHIVVPNVLERLAKQAAA